jgi:glycosyltransferase involved in cell wall biosynthesis
MFAARPITICPRLLSLSVGGAAALATRSAAGLPVVATDVGGVRQVVDDGSTAFLAPVKDDAFLAMSILSLAGDPDRHRRIVLAGRASAKRYFDETRMTDQYGRLYRELAAV